MWQTLLGPLADLAGDALERFGPAKKMDESERMELKRQMTLAMMADEQKTLEVSMSAILAEAKSADPWTSRARPSFLYVMYAMILAAIPMGIVSAIHPETAIAIADGMQAWLGSIPEGLWAVFGAGYLGYSASRSWDKKNILKGK